MRYGMLIDLNTCAGCSACAMACKMQNGTLQETYWCKVLVKEQGKYPDAKKKVLPIGCMHCINAPCVKNCPTGASYHAENGTVQIDQNKCIGCRVCMNACPYGARSFNGAAAEKNPYFAGFKMTPYEKVKGASHPIGKVEKCVLCKDRVAEGKEPACVQTCITKSRIFGDLDDPNSAVSKQIIATGAKPLYEHCGTKPCIYYAGTF